MNEVNLAVFEFVLKGYDGSTDETDNLIKWVAAESEGVAKIAMKRLGFDYTEVNFCESLTEKDAGIDLIVRESLFDK